MRAVKGSPTTLSKTEKEEERKQRRPGASPTEEAGSSLALPHQETSRRVAGAQSAHRQRSGDPSRWCSHTVSPCSPNEDDGTVCDLRGVAERRLRSRRRQSRALLEGPLAIVTTDRIAQPSDDAPQGFTPRRNKQPQHPHHLLSEVRTGRSGGAGTTESLPRAIVPCVKCKRLRSRFANPAYETSILTPLPALRRSAAENSFTKISSLPSLLMSADGSSSVPSL